MSITKEVKKDLISKFSINDKDTGSAEVQIAVQTERINNLIEHFKNINPENKNSNKIIWYDKLNEEIKINKSNPKNRTRLFNIRLNQKIT